MGIVEYALIGAFVGVAVTLISYVFKGKKKNKKITETKVEEPIKDEPKKEDTKEPEKDRSFKIVKKSRLSRISKKALDTNARTATVEKVFERTPPMPTSSETEVLINPLDSHSQQILQSLEGVDVSNKKVVSFKELQQLSKRNINQANMQEEEEYSSAKYLSSGRAGEVTGDYTGIHLGSGKHKKPENYRQKIQENFDDLDDSVDFQSMLSHKNLFSTDFSPIERMPFKQPLEEQPVDTDFSDIVVAEAILNPKYKTKHQKNKKN